MTEKMLKNHSHHNQTVLIAQSSLTLSLTICPLCTLLLAGLKDLPEAMYKFSWSA